MQVPLFPLQAEADAVPNDQPLKLRVEGLVVVRVTVAEAGTVTITPKLLGHVKIKSPISVGRS